MHWVVFEIDVAVRSVSGWRMRRLDFAEIVIEGNCPNDVVKLPITPIMSPEPRQVKNWKEKVRRSYRCGLQCESNRPSR